MIKRGHDSRAIANIFIRKFRADEREVTKMILNKLIYFAHGWTLGYTGAPLIRHAVEAWKSGPVVHKVADGHKEDSVYARALLCNFF